MGKSFNLLDLLYKLRPAADIAKIEQLLAAYRFNMPSYCQTLTQVAECSIEMILRKRTQYEMDHDGNY